MQNYARLGIFGILALIALRVGLGWHFYMEGVTKVRGKDFSSVGFLTAARGPLADRYQQLIWDNEGLFRLDQERVIPEFDRGAAEASAHFGFTTEQQQEADRVRRQYVSKLGDVYATADEDIYKYWQSTERIAEMDESDMWTNIASLRGQRETIKAERMAGVQDTLATVDAVWRQYEGRLNSIASEAQREAAGRYYFNRPGEGLFTARVVDRIIPIFDMVVGILLIIGLLTPVAAGAAAIFLISVILSQMPGYPGAQPTYFQVVECLALIVVAATDAGRFAGLDFLPWAWWQRRKAARAAAVT